MADGRITWDLDANASKLMMKMVKVSQALQNMDAAADKAGKKVGMTFSEGAMQAGQFAMKIAGIGSAVAGVMALADQLKAEYEFLVTRQREAANTQVTASQAKNFAELNRPIDIDKSTVEPELRKISAATGMTMTELYRGLGPTYSARGSLTPEQMWDAYGNAADLSIRTGGMANLGVISGRGMDIMRYTGADSKTSLGWLLSVGQQARVQEINKQAEGLISAISMASALGMSQEEAAEFYAFNTIMSGSTEGERDATFAAGILGAMHSGEIKIPYMGINNSGEMSILWRKPKSRTFKGQMAEFQGFANSNPGQELMDAFITQIPGRERTKGGFISLITQSPQGMDAYRHIQEMILDPRDPANLAFYEERTNQTGPVDMMEQTRRIQAAQNAMLDSARLGNIEGLSGQVRGMLDDLVRNTPGMSDAERKLLTAQFEINTGAGTRGGAEVIREAIRRMKEYRRLPGAGAPYLAYDVEDVILGPGGQRLPSWSGSAAGVGALPEDAEAFGTRPGQMISRQGTNSILDDVRYNPNPNANPMLYGASENMLDILNKILAELQRRNVTTMPTPEAP